jgi:putative tricarboxylic transport membrane protein
MASDRIFGLVALFVALAYIASATQIQTSFLADPIGPKSFPILIGCVAIIAALFLIWRPDPNPDWPVLRTWGALAVSVVVLVAYAFALKPGGFLLPTAVAASVISYQISPRPLYAGAAGVTLSIGLFVLFKFALGLSLKGVPQWLFG